MINPKDYIAWKFADCEELFFQNLDKSGYLAG